MSDCSLLASNSRLRDLPCQVGKEVNSHAPYHYQLHQIEIFDFRDGTPFYLIDGKEGMLQKDEKVSIPPYRPHMVSFVRERPAFLSPCN